MSTKNFFIMKVMRVGLLLICLAICFWINRMFIGEGSRLHGTQG